MDTVRDLIAMDIDIDVFDNVCEDLAINFIGPMELTTEGEKKFGEVMGYAFEIVPGEETWSGLPHCVIDVDDPDEKICARKMRKAKEFFDAAAGFCPVDDYNRWFKEVE